MRQLLAMIPNVPCLYGHEVNSTYYGIKKLKGKEKDICVGLGALPDTNTKAGGHANRNAGFIRQPQRGSPVCRMNPAFRWWCQDTPSVWVLRRSVAGTILPERYHETLQY